MRLFVPLLAVLVGCIDAAAPAPELDDSIRKAPLPPSDWARVARLGGLTVQPGVTDLALGSALSTLVDQHVTVVEADSRLSEHLDDAAFETELALMRRVADMAHERNLKVVWYGTSLEVVSVGGESGPSMAKEHPDWVQLSWDGTPNVFTGSKVFWVDPGDESAWMSPRSGYREYFFERLERIAQSGIDGFWLDVPLYNDIVGRWASFNPADVARFKADTGLDMPVVTAGRLDPADPVARAWIWWRHQEIDRFLKDALARIRAANPAFTLIVETVTMDYNAAVLEGLDGAMQGPLDGFLHVWEVDVLSDDSAMRRAVPNDVFALIAMYKFGRGADAGRPAWAFSYGAEDDDAELVMAVCVAAGVNPYELKAPEMTTTVGAAFRTRLFGWLEAHEDQLFRATSRARVALLHSSASRAVGDGCLLSGLCGVALFSSWENPAPGKPWWTPQEADRVEATQYMAEYRGLAKALTELHVPFDLRPSRLLTAADAARYDVLIAPSLEALSDAELAVLRGFVEGGGQLLFTHAPPGRASEDGALRPTGAFADLLPEIGRAHV